MTAVQQAHPRSGTARADAAVAGDRGKSRGAVLLLLGSGFSVQFGAAVAALLFPRIGPVGAVTLRLGLAAVLLLVACRPRLRGYRRSDWAVVAAFGTALAGMNTLFYEAIDRIPLGAAVTLEVLGPLVLSVVAARRAASWLWAALALAGVALLGRSGFGGLNLAGAGFALGAAAMWAGYILLSARTGSRFPKVDGLALAVTIAALITLPPGAVTAGPDLLRPATLGLGAAVAVLSAALPYSLELLSLRKLPAATFAILMSLSPAIAATAGYLVLQQALHLSEGLAIALVVIASIGAVRSSARPQLGAPTGARPTAASSSSVV
jgi:inner membrane transporter RhtA